MSSILTQKITVGRVIKYALPIIIMQVFLSLYSIVDGVFVSRLVGSEALAAINISYPGISMMVALSIMFATGGSAIVAKLLGEKQEKEARRVFTFLVAVALIVGSILSVLVFFHHTLAQILRSNRGNLPLCQGIPPLYLTLRT